MAKSSTTETAKSGASQGRLRLLGRLLFRLLRWFVVSTVLAVVIGGVVAAIAWSRLTDVVNLVANRFVAPYRVQVGLVDASNPGIVVLQDLFLYPPEKWKRTDEASWVEIERFEITYDLAELRNERRFRVARLVNPVIRIDDGSLNLLPDAERARDDLEEDAEEGALDLSFLGRLADRVEVVGGILEIDTSRGPALTTKWDLAIPEVNFADPDWITREPLILELSEIRLGEESRLGTIGGIQVAGRLRGDLSGIEVMEVGINRPRLDITPEDLPGVGSPPEAETEVTEARGETGPEPESGPSALPGDPTTGEGFEVLVDALQLTGAEISLSGFDGQEGRPLIPDAAFKTTMEWEDLRIQGSDISSSSPITLSLQDFVIDGREPGQDRADAPPMARIGQFRVIFDPETLSRDRRIELVEMIDPEIYLTPDTTAVFLREKETELIADSSPSPSPSPSPTEGDANEPEDPRPEAQVGGWELGRLMVKGGSLKAEQWAWESRELPGVFTEWELDWKELSDRALSLKPDETDLSPDAPPQHLRLSDLQIGGTDLAAGGETDDSLLAVESLLARFDFRALLGRHQWDRLEIEKPVLVLSDERLPDWLPAFLEGRDTGSREATEASSEEQAASSDPGGPPESVVGPVRPWVVNHLSVNEGEFTVDTQSLKDRLPRVEGRFQLSTEALPPGAEVSEIHPYRLFLSRLKVRARNDGAKGEEGSPESEGTVASAKELIVDVTAEGLQRDHRVERVELKGADFFLGSGLKELMQGEDESPPDPAEEKAPAEDPAVQEPAVEPGNQAAAANAPDRPEWVLGEFMVTESRIHIESLIPQIEGLNFAIETRMEDIPLGEAGLLAQDHPQKIELAGIELRDPYDSFITVALLPTVFVEFSLAGLLDHRIDKIDLINPSLYVGQGLFWWVDYQRNYRKQNEGVGVEGVGAGAADAEAAEPARIWSIDQIDASFGKLVIAPTGQPIGVVPFPFNAETDLTEGEIALSFKIPKEEQYVFEFPDLELALFGLSGEVDFNVPIQQEDNNLVQTFTLDRAVWKQFEAESLYLTVTYDEEGIYGRFGGVAYGGYAEGQFNVYLDDVGLWDAWIAGTNMDMEPITKIIAPESILMAGKVNAKLVSEGRKLEFGETHGEVQTLSPGHFDFTKANQFIENLPEGWSNLKRSTAQLGLETLKRFDYDTGKGDLFFVNRDGWLRLNLEGETGTRRLEVFTHDWRGKPDGEGDAEETVTEEKDGEESDPAPASAASGDGEPGGSPAGRKTG